MVDIIDKQPFQLSNPPPKPKKAPPQKREQAWTKKEKQDAAYWANRHAPASEQELWFRHTCWKTKRALVRATLAAVNTSTNALERFDDCGCECVVEYCKAEERYRIRGTYCHNRHCEPCQKAKANLLAANLRKRLLEKPDGRYRFITLTLKHNDAPLREQIDRLYSCFKNIRNSKLWKESQNGGCVVLEVKWQAHTKKWHPHLHIIAEGGFITQRELSSAWHATTGDSQIVDIRQLSNEKDAAHYVAKYVSKGTNDDVWKDPNAAQEWVLAMKGVRAASTFGTWRGFKLLNVEKDAQEWQAVGTMSSIVTAARAGQPWAVTLLRKLLDSLQYNPHKPRTKRQE